MGSSKPYTKEYLREALSSKGGGAYPPITVKNILEGGQTTTLPKAAAMERKFKIPAIFWDDYYAEKQAAKEAKRQARKNKA